MRSANIVPTATLDAIIAVNTYFITPRQARKISSSGPFALGSKEDVQEEIHFVYPMLEWYITEFAGWFIFGLEFVEFESISSYPSMKLCANDTSN